MNKKPEAALTAAARALDEDLARFEELAQELSRVQVNSEKALQRARQALEGCSEHEQQLAGSLQAFAEAMQTIAARQQRCMEQTAHATAQIQARHEQRTALLERVAALGASARSVTAPLGDLGEPTAAPSTEVLASIQERARRLEATIEEAAAVAVAAKQDEWFDIARDAETLQQQLQAVRNRVLQSQRKLASQAPS